MYWYLHEVCSEIKSATGLTVAPSTVCKMLKQYGYTRKKIQHIATQRSKEYRASFIADMSFYKKEMLVWVDESGCDKRNLLRKFGYSLRGERTICPRLLVRGTRISAVAALCWNGLLGVELTTDSMNGEIIILKVH